MKKIYKNILMFFKHTFTWFKWNKEFGVLGNIWWNVQLPNSRGERSLSVTFLVYLGVLPIMAAGITEIYLVIFRGKEFSIGFWGVLGTLATGAVAGFTFSEADKRKVLKNIEKIVKTSNKDSTKQAIQNTVKIIANKVPPKPDLES